MYNSFMIKVGEAVVGLLIGIAIVILVDPVINTIQRAYYTLNDRSWKKKHLKIAK